MPTVLAPRSARRRRIAGDYYTWNQYQLQGGRFDTLEYYQGLVDRCCQLQPHRTEKLIRPPSGTEFGKPVRSLFSKLGKADYLKCTRSGVDVAFYRCSLGKYQARLTAHFLGDQLFLYSYEIPALSVQRPDQVVTVLIHKYLNDECSELPLPLHIGDHREGHILCSADDDSLHISYLTISKRVSRHLRGYEEEAEKRLFERERRARQDLYEKL